MQKSSKGPDLCFTDHLVITLGLAFTYFMGSRLGISFMGPGDPASPFWPPSGIGLAAVIIFGWSNAIPGIALGTLLFNIQYTTSPTALSGFILGAVSEAVMGGYLLQLFRGGDFRLRNSRDILILVLVGVFLAPLLSSNLGVLGVYFNGVLPLEFLPRLWITYFLGNALGILVFTPLLLVLYSQNHLSVTNALKVSEALLLVVSLIGFSIFALKGRGDFLIYPLFIWAALRFGFAGVSISTLIVTAVAFWYSAYGVAVFAHKFSFNVIWIQSFAAICCLGGYLMAAARQSERRMMEKEIESLRYLEHKRIAEEALALLDQAIQKSPVGFALVDRSFRYLKINEALAVHNGLSVGEHLGKTLRDVLQDAALPMEELISHVFASGEPILSIPVKGISRGEFSREVYGLMSYYPVRQPGVKDILGVAISFEDLTEYHMVQSKLRENQSRLNFAQMAGKMGIFDWDMRKDTLHWTPQLEAIYGYEKDEFNQRYETWIGHVHPDDRNMVLTSLDVVIREQVDLNLQYRIIRKDGIVRWVLARGGLRKDDVGTVIGFSGINIDVTEQKYIEERLRKAEGELLNALAARDEFFAIASHELKTPLTSLKLQIQLFQRAILRNDPLTQTRDKVSQLLDKNFRQVTRLTRLVEDMLDISRIRTGKLTLKREACEISQIILDLVQRSREQFINCGSGEPVVRLHTPSFGLWDPMRIEQVFLNLFNNAIRYGLGKPISIFISSQEDRVRISIADQGMGIAKEEQKRIFQRFERGTTREVSGLGLGLFISQQIIEAHSGRIWVESESGKGSTFHVELPCLKESAVEEELNHAKSPEG